MPAEHIHPDEHSAAVRLETIMCAATILLPVPVAAGLGANDVSFCTRGKGPRHGQPCWACAVAS